MRDNMDAWSDRLQEAEDLIASAYETLSVLQRELKEAGRKKDMMAISEVVERLARYGRLFEDMRQSWNEVDD